MANKQKMDEMNTSDDSSSWGYLPEHLLDSILDRLITISDYVQFAAVCKRWFSAARFHHVEWQLNSNPKQLPMLLIPTDDSSETHRRMCTIAGKELNLNNNKQLHVPYNRRCCGSSFGWLIFALDNYALILYNPFTGATIHLPPFIKEADIDTNDDDDNIFLSPQYEVQKVVLSEDPGLFPDTYQVLVLHEFMGYIYLFKSGSHDCWIHIDRPEILRFDFIEDIVYYRGKFYLAGSQLLASVEVDYRLKLRRVNVPVRSTFMQKFYLVESSNGDLLYIGRVYIRDEELFQRDPFARPTEPYGFIKIDDNVYPYRNCYASLTRRFLVYKLNIQDDDDDEDGKQMGNCEFEWQSNLGGESFFLGISHSMSLSARDVPGCQPNCIYYTDDEYTIPTREHGAIDIGVFDFNDNVESSNNQGEAKHLYATAEKHILLPPPIWIIPRASFHYSFSSI